MTIAELVITLLFATYGLAGLWFAFQLESTDDEPDATQLIRMFLAALFWPIKRDW